MGSLDSVLACAPLVTYMLCTLIHILLAVLALVHGLAASQGPAGQGQSYPGNKGRVVIGSLPRCLPRQSGLKSRGLGPAHGVALRPLRSHPGEEICSLRVLRASVKPVGQSGQHPK